MNTSLNEEIKELSHLKYFELCDYLQQKYGVPDGNYFLTNSCSTQNPKIKRSDEGLFIHHIKECEFPDLSQKDKALLMPFEWQEGRNLVYCNYFEHLLLHIDIVLEFMTKEFIGFDYKSKPIVVVGMGGLVNHILPEIVDYINGYQYQRPSYLTALKIIDGNEMLFIELVKDFENELKKRKHGLKNGSAAVMQGRKFHADFFKGKMTFGHRRINDLLFEYDVIHGNVCPPSLENIQDKIHKIIEEDKAYITSTKLSYIKNNTEYVIRYRVIKSTKFISFLLREKGYKSLINEFIEQITDRFVINLKGDTCVLVPKNSDIQPKKIRGKDKYCFVINGIKIDKPLYSLRVINKLITEYKKQYS